MTSTYLNKSVRTPREAATDMRLRSQFHPELAEWADRLDRYADDVEEREDKETRRARVAVSVAALAAGSTSVAGAVLTQGTTVGVVAAVVATAASLNFVSKLTR